MTPEDEELDDEHWELLFAAQRSVRYHRHRQRFFDNVHAAGSLLTAIFGSATFVGVWGGQEQSWVVLVALATAVASAMEIVLRPAAVARDHSELARDFIGLEQDLRRARVAGLTPESMQELTSLRLAIEAKEPPIHLVLDTICHNELIRSLGMSQDEMVDVRWDQRIFRNVFDISPGRLETRSRIKARAALASSDSGAKVEQLPPGLA